MKLWRSICAVGGKMKQIVYGMICTFMLTCIFMIVMTIYGRNLRQTEADHTLAEAVDTAMEDVLKEKSYGVSNSNEFVADFLQLLLRQLNSTSDVTVSVLEADEEMGILSVEIVENFKHPNGKDGTVSKVRTVILDKPQEIEKEYKTVSFYLGDDELYKEYTVLKDTFCTIPLPPEKEGKTFSHWRFVEGDATGKAESVSVSGENGSRQVIAASGEAYAVTADTKMLAVFSP